jgi:hypothetical protein
VGTTSNRPGCQQPVPHHPIPTLDPRRHGYHVGCGLSGGQTISLDKLTLTSSRLGLIDRPDRLIRTEGTIVVEEWKSSRQVRPWHLAQMGVYFLLVEPVQFSPGHSGPMVNVRGVIVSKWYMAWTIRFSTRHFSQESFSSPTVSEDANGLPSFRTTSSRVSEKASPKGG